MHLLRFYLLILSSLLLGYLSVIAGLSALHGWAPAMLSFNRYGEGWIEVVLLLVLTPVSAYMSYREWRHKWGVERSEENRSILAQIWSERLYRGLTSHTIHLPSVHADPPIANISDDTRNLPS